jgi:hypothetical protein
MKPLLLLICALSCSAVAAKGQGQGLPSFDGKIGTPELSLTESLKQNASRADEASAVTASIVSPNRLAGAPKMVSNMPVIIPSEEIDKNMPIVRPDDSIDYKMIIRAPSVEAKGEVRLAEMSERLAELRARREAALNQKRYLDELRELELNEEAQKR